MPKRIWGYSVELEPSISLSDEELDFLAEHIDEFEAGDFEELEAILDEVEKRTTAKACRDDLIAFCRHMQPDYKVGRHHRRLADQLMAVAEGKKDRICVNIPPRHGKSHLVSTYFPAWFLGKYPDKKVLMVSHTTDLAVDFGRKVRNVIDTPKYKTIFPTVSLAADNKSAGRWNTNVGGEFYACGVGSALAGRGADLLLVDDPHNEQDIINGNLDIFDRAYEWFTYGARTRLMPGGRVAIIQCMVGDTQVLMADGSEKDLKDIQVGDSVATYDNGKLTTSKVLNWANQGGDVIFTVKTTSRIIRANERHPFLVQLDTGDLQWIRLKNLQPGMQLVSLKDATVRDGQKLNPESVKLVNLKTAGIENTPMLPIISSDTTESGKESNALKKDVMNPHIATGCVSLTTANKDTLPDQNLRQNQIELGISSTGTDSRWKSTISSLLNKVACVLYVKTLQLKTILAGIGRTSCVSTIATTQGKSEPYFVTTATSQLDTQKLGKSPLQLQNISDFTTETIESIELTGCEDVFDIQVEATENFIANGIVSHNTRWHQDDLTGRMVRDMTQNEDSDQYEVIEFPAIFNENTPDEEALWPEFFDLTALKRTKASMPIFQWNAQYQQNPTAEEGSIIKREWWNWWKNERPPSCEYIIMSLDSAAEIKNRSDFTALTTWGVFFNEETEAYNIILLNSIKKRLEFPELKDLAINEWREWNPDSFIVEKKSSGVALYQELRRTGMPVTEYTPHRGTGDKLARLNSVTDIVKSGLVWVPETRWAEEVVEEIAGFPFMSHDDLVDSTVMALMRFRQGGFIRLPTDEPEDPRFFKKQKRSYY